MNIETLTILEHCDAAGLQLSLLPDGNLLAHPRERLTPALLSEIRASKAALIKAIHPYITEQGELVIPTCSPDKFKWWQGGQSTLQTLAELSAPPELIARHTAEPVIPHKGKDQMVAIVHNAVTTTATKRIAATAAPSLF